MYHIHQEENREKKYRYMVMAVKDLLATEKDALACLANTTAFIQAYMDGLNWVGFYILREDTLVLGPFQGKPACIRIKPGKGVCGTAFAEKRVIRVEDVRQFPGHIACDSETRSEIVLPLYTGTGDRGYGVLDLDSPHYGRFTALEEQYLREICHALSQTL